MEGDGHVAALGADPVGQWARGSPRPRQNAGTGPARSPAGTGRAPGSPPHSAGRRRRRWCRRRRPALPFGPQRQGFVIAQGIASRSPRGALGAPGETLAEPHPIEGLLDGLGFGAPSEDPLGHVQLGLGEPMVLPRLAAGVGHGGFPVRHGVHAILLHSVRHPLGGPSVPPLGAPGRRRLAPRGAKASRMENARAVAPPRCRRSDSPHG